MSFENYKLSIEIAALPLEAVLMAYMRGADDVALSFLIAKHPDIYRELKARYNAPGGKLDGEGD